MGYLLEVFIKCKPQRHSASLTRQDGLHTVVVSGVKPDHPTASRLDCRLKLRSVNWLSLKVQSHGSTATSLSRVNTLIDIH